MFVIEMNTMNTMTNENHGHQKATEICNQFILFKSNDLESLNLQIENFFDLV